MTEEEFKKAKEMYDEVDEFELGERPADVCELGDSCESCQ